MLDLRHDPLGKADALLTRILAGIETEPGDDAMVDVEPQIHIADIGLAAHTQERDDDQHQ